jgi:hypothetical protein
VTILKTIPALLTQECRAYDFTFSIFYPVLGGALRKPGIQADLTLGLDYGVHID